MAPMGDLRFRDPLERVRDAHDRQAAIRDLSYDDLVLALGASSRERDPYVANVLTTELLNRSRRGTALVVGCTLGAAAAFLLLLSGIALLSTHPHNFDDHVFLLLAAAAFGLGAAGAVLARGRVLTRLLDRKA